jgi:hypothetical protein
MHRSDFGLLDSSVHLCDLSVSVLNSNAQGLDQRDPTEEFTTEFTEGHGEKPRIISWFSLCNSVISEPLC